MGSLTLSLNFSQVNIHIAKIMFVFTYDGGNSWFETEMIKNGEDHQAILSDIPDQGTLIYFLKIIDVFDEEFIDNNNNQYYSLPYICPLQPHVSQEDLNQNAIPDLEDSPILDSASSEIKRAEIETSSSETDASNIIENDNSLSLNADDMSISIANGSLKTDLEIGDDTGLVENPLEGQKFDEDEKSDDESADSDEAETNGSESEIYDSEPVESKENQPENIVNANQIDDKTILLNRAPPSEEQVEYKQTKKTTHLIKPVAPKKIIMPVQTQPESSETESKTPPQKKTTSVKTQVEVKTNENAAGVFLRGSKKVEKKNKEKENPPPLIPLTTPETGTQQSQNNQEPSIPQEQKELMEKIFALSRYKAKQETEKETQQGPVGKGNDKTSKELAKNKANLAKLDNSSDKLDTNEGNGTINISPLFSQDNLPIKVKHPFSTAMYEYISKNGSLVAIQDPKSKKKEEKSDKKPCRKCEAVIMRDWRICPICGAKN